MSTCYGADPGSFVPFPISSSAIKLCVNNSQAGFYDQVHDAQTCCFRTEECGAGSMCKSSSISGTGSGYHSSGCTDPTYQSPLCPRYCVGRDMVHVGDGIWACCSRTTDGSDAPNCSNPLLNQVWDLGWSPEQFPGSINLAYTPANATILAQATTSSTSTTASRTSAISGAATTTVPPESTTSIGSVDADRSGLGIGAKAGIGVGVSLGVLALALVATFWALRSRRRTARSAKSQADMTVQDNRPPVVKMAHHGHTPNHMSATKPVNELPDLPRTYELQADTWGTGR